jgi:hypothetical protein
VTFMDFVVTYVVPAAIVLSMVLGLMRYLASRGTAGQKNFKEYTAEANRLGVCNGLFWFGDAQGWLGSWSTE